MNSVNIVCDLTVFDGRFAYIKPAMLFLNVLVNCRDKSNNVVKMDRQDMLEAVCDENDKKVTERTLKGWISLLCMNGAIKYNYGTNVAIINPEYVFEGSQEEFNKALNNYKKFKSDVQFKEVN